QANGFQQSLVPGHAGKQCLLEVHDGLRILLSQVLGVLNWRLNPGLDRGLNPPRNAAIRFHRLAHSVTAWVSPASKISIRRGLGVLIKARN
ncbi:MAG: hypothetical protein COB31_01345, partial [Erythrobacter sp.]